MLALALLHPGLALLSREMAAITFLYFSEKSIAVWTVTKLGITGLLYSQTEIKTYNRIKIQGLVKCKIYILHIFFLLISQEPDNFLCNFIV